MSTSTPQTALEKAHASIHSTPYPRAFVGDRGGGESRAPSRATELVASVEGDLRRLARRIAGDGTLFEADDLLQRGLEVAYERAPAFEAERGKSFFALVYLRAHGAMVDACRQPVRAAMCELSEEVATVGSYEDAVVEKEEAEALRGRVAAALGKLKPEERVLVEACAIRGVSVAEAAKEMGIAYQTAWERYDAGKRKMRRTLGACTDRQLGRVSLAV